MFNTQYNYGQLNSGSTLLPYPNTPPKRSSSGLFIGAGIIGAGVLIGMALGLGLGIGAAGLNSNTDLLNVTNTTGAFWFLHDCVSVFSLSEKLTVLLNHAIWPLVIDHSPHEASDGGVLIKR